MMRISKTLYAKFQAYQTWLDDGAPDREPFLRKFGLCANFGYGGDFDALRQSFDLHRVYPFCTEAEYNMHYIHHTQHLCAARNAFVKRVLEEGEIV
jgi:hypothetical protein